MARALPGLSPQGNNMFRSTFLVFNYKNLSEKIASFQHDLLVYKTKELLVKEKFFTERTFDPPRTDIFNSETVTAVSSALKYWAEYGSFYICDRCESVVAVNMPYNFMKRPKTSIRNKCKCRKGRYEVPRYAHIPKQLLNLSAECIHALRPFEIDCGIYERQRHGYRVKTAMTLLKPSDKPVLEKICDLLDRKIEKTAT